MNQIWKIDKDKHTDLNFALGCLYCDAVSLFEFKKWAELVIQTSDVSELPYYIYDILDFNEPLFHLTKLIGFDLINDLSKEEEYSIYGIAFLRNNNIYDPPINKNEAVSYVTQNRHILERFHKFFPFIEGKIFSTI